MKIYCLDVVTSVSKSGKSYTRGAFRGKGKSGDYLFLATCPGDFEPMTEYDVNVAFGERGNYILPY